MKQVFFTCLLFMVGSSHIVAKERDTTQMNISHCNHKSAFYNASYSRFIVPAAFISYGALAQCIDDLQRIDRNTQKHANKNFSGRIYADNYFQYIPAVAVYGLDLAGVKAKHNIRDRTFLMASSYLLSTACVQTLKRTTNVIRPDDSDHFSFPSGHTATAFVGAHLLFKEYKNTSPWICISGYFVAGGIGAFRILNRKHWVSDVVAGAGFGILSVEISYVLLPVFYKAVGIKDMQTSLAMTPIISNHHYGIGLAYTF